LELAAGAHDEKDFGTRPATRGPYSDLVLDALRLKCRDGGHTVNASVYAVAVNKAATESRSTRRHHRVRTAPPGSLLAL
jgi:hypothetical protein